MSINPISDLIEKANQIARTIEDDHRQAINLGDRRRYPKLAKVAAFSLAEAVPTLRMLAEELQKSRQEASAAKAEIGRLTHPAMRNSRSNPFDEFDDLLGYDEADFF